MTNLSKLVSELQDKSRFYSNKSQAYSALAEMIIGEPKIDKQFLKEIWSVVYFAIKLDLMQMKDLDIIRDYMDEYESGEIND